LLLGCLLGLASCINTVERAPGGLLQRSQQDPALSGNGKMLAVIVDQRGRPTVQLRDLQNGKILPLRHFSRHQPHSSPSLSWNGRYLAAITQRGDRRLTIIEDRLTGRVHPLPLPGGRAPVRLSLSPDARQLALQVAYQGHWRIEVFDLSQILEPDPSSRLRRSISSTEMGS
jgi:Tol biopolymer transport system component